MEKFGIVKRTCGALFVLCCALVRTAEAASASNGKVVVSCDAPRVQIEVNGNDFDVLAPGYPDTFVTNVMVAAVSPWRLVKPTANELPLKMSGGDRAGYLVVREPEDADSGTIAFHNYYIESDQNDGAKDIGVAMGTSVTYTAYKNGSRCPSEWVVNGETNQNTSSIIFNRRWWNVLGWFFPSIDTPKAGLYLTDAHDVTYNDLDDHGRMAVFGADFLENTNHPYGFDDYTDWEVQDESKGADYYGSRVGRSVWPYASVNENHDGFATLRILSFGHSKMFDIVSDCERAAFSPTSTTGSVQAQFNIAGAYNAGEFALSAEYDGTELARLRVVPFKLQTRRILVVTVNGASSSVNISALNGFYRQCVTEFSLSGIESFTYTSAPVGNVWTRQDRMNLMMAVQSDVTMANMVDNVDHVVLVIAGRDSYSQNVLAWGVVSGKYIWIYASRFDAQVMAHEIGHNFGLSDEYTFVPNVNSVPGEDRNNVMNMKGSGTGNRFRYNQWKTINKN